MKIKPLDMLCRASDTRFAISGYAAVRLPIRHDSFGSKLEVEDAG